MVLLIAQTVEGFAELMLVEGFRRLTRLRVVLCLRLVVLLLLLPLDFLKPTDSVIERVEFY